MGKPILITPPTGKSTGINSAKIDIARKNKIANHILENEGKEGVKYMKRAIANVVITIIYIFNFKDKLYYPFNYK
jgi:hypothetical protein